MRVRLKASRAAAGGLSRCARSHDLLKPSISFTFHKKVQHNLDRAVSSFGLSIEALPLSSRAGGSDSR